jgi:hypothetical protein
MAQAVGRLNVFQRLAMQWETLHPYNAAQYLIIRGDAPPPARLHATWHDTLETLGLGRPHTDGPHFHFEQLNGQAPREPVRRIVGESVEQHVSRELNRPFDDDSDVVPFRPFIRAGDDGESYAIGLIYHHWVADSSSIRMVLREWFLRLHDPAAARQSPLRLPATGYWGLFGPRQCGWRVADAALTLARWTSRFRKVSRVIRPINVAEEFHCSFTSHRAPDGLLGPLLTAARRGGVTLHDVFLAALAESCDRVVPLHRSRLRKDLALGSVVDLRPHSRRDLSDTFGLFLGFTSTMCTPADLSRWPRLLRVIARQGALHKRTGVPQASGLRMLLGWACGNALSRDEMIHFYRKRIPFAGGISNVNLNRCWAGRYHPSPLLEYVRVSPTGPMMPLVLTTTTLGDRLHIGLTRRTAVLSESAAHELVERFLQRLRSVAEAGDAFAANGDHEE